MPVMRKMEIKKLKPKNRRYLGSKHKLLDKIKEVIEEECTNVNSFLDLFAGTGVVGELFNNENTSVVFNDSLTSNYYSYLAWFGNQQVRESFVNSLIDNYNDSKAYEDNYVSLNFSNTFFSTENCKKIGYIREDIEAKYSQKLINDREKAILITSLLMSMDKIANTVGHYDAFLRKGNLDKELILYHLDIPDDRINRNNQIFCEDANELIKTVKSDIVYIDPPYNSRQYCDAYHLLENIAEWKQPPVEGVAKKFDRKGKKSKYNLRNAPKVFDELIQNINAKYILVSYNNMGQKGANRSNAKISDFDIMNSLSKRGKVLEYSVKYQHFTTGKSNISDHQERLFLCKVGDFPKNESIQKNVYDFVKSPLNYTGGKFKLLPQLIAKFPENIESFIDLFGGGFNVGVNVVANKIIYNDNNVQVQRIIKLLHDDSPETVVNKIDEIIYKYGLSDSQKNGYEYYSCNSDSGLGSYNKEKYYILRKDYNLQKTSKYRDYLLLTLIIFSFNNQIRFNSIGEYNMPIGKRDFNSSIRSNLIKFSSKLKTKDVVFLSKDFLEIKVSNESFVYCDPPYLLGVASYNESEGWNIEKEKSLLEYLDSLNSRGVRFALSNVIEHKGKTNDLLHDWIEKNHYNKIFIRSSYNNSNYQIQDKNGSTREVLITNYF